MFPLDLTHAASWVEPSVHVGIGIAFGAVLERAGFGSARKLTNQFYLNDMSVLKVMFTGIITTAVLVSISVTFGFIDFDRLWVNPTFLGSGIVGGMIFGVGFVVGGYCPGTALVAAANLKVDAIVFALGVLGGIWLFGYTVPSFDQFWQESGNLGRYTLADWFGLPLPWVVLLVVLLALVFFAAGEWVERWVLRRSGIVAPGRGGRGARWKLAAALILPLVALVPSLAFSRTAKSRPRSAETRLKQAIDGEVAAVSAWELADILRERRMDLRLVDLRSESAFNHFHLQDAQNLPSGSYATLLRAPVNQVKILIAANDVAGKQAYAALQSKGIENLYWLKDGINGWLGIMGLTWEAISAKPGLGDKHDASCPPREVGQMARYVTKVHPPGGGGKKKGGGCSG